jgi:uncharacterized membrane protein YphA (DoxX/SURF4 family)
LLLQRSSYSFPMGLPGIALLLLRTTVGLTMLIRGGACLPEGADRSGVYIASALGILAGGLLLVGFLTMFAGIGGGMVAMLTAFKVLPICASGGFDSRLGLIFGLAILLALAILGPGAYSIDARLFGRREIIIPPVSTREP